jgi:YaiO family outer membrane protein
MIHGMSSALPGTLLGLLLGAGFATSVAAQEPELDWSAVLYYDTQQIARTPERAYWHTLTAGVGRALPHGSISVHAISTHRFEIHDQALALDLYHDLWPGAYANVVARVADHAEVLPNYSASAEVYQSIGGQEISASYQHQEFAVADVNTFGLGTGHYVGAWYLRPRSLVANIDDSWSPFFAFSARRYLDERTDDYVDFSLGLGEEVLEVAPLPSSPVAVDVITSASRFASLRTQRFLGRHVGGFVGATYSDYQAIPDRWGVSLGIISRW